MGQEHREDKALQRALVLGAEETIQEVVRAGLRDRDYEALPTGERLLAHRQLPGDVKLIVCDCVDGEPVLETARFLLAHHAGLVVQGALIAAFATTSRRVVVHVAADDQQGADAVAAAIEKVSAADDLVIGLVRGPFRQDLRGYEAVPTLVMTGETLLHIARILGEGAGEYRDAGIPRSPGTKLFQVSGIVKRPGVYELPLGTTLRRLIDDECGGIAEGETLQAVIVGGAKGGCLRTDELDLPLDFDSVASAGGAIGRGGIAVLGQGDCIIDQVRQRLACSCYDECGKCSLGREGSYQLREIVTDATRGKSRGSDLEMLREIARGMRLGGACGFGRTAPNIVISSMERFPEEYEAHMKRKRCRALVCVPYVTFHILPDLCDGCGACAEECPEDAIEGGRRKIHVIDQDSCEKCGACYEVCLGLRKAVVKAGAVKPRP